jgi:molybdate transport system substrate-binding protein
MPRSIAVFLAIFSLIGPTASADTLHVFAAGSLTDAFSDLLRRFPAGPDSVAPADYGPSGLLREKIETGAPADILASADMDQARRLAFGHPERSVITFTRNRLCVLARDAIGLTPINMLDRLLDPSVRLATSTPGADPGGDYAWAVFVEGRGGASRRARCIGDEGAAAGRRRRQDTATGAGQRSRRGRIPC